MINEMDRTLLEKMLQGGYVNVRQHPKEDLFIYNYSSKTQFEKAWNDVTLQCRGLIMDAQGRVVARPFPKFFNLGEVAPQTIPKEPFEVYEKMDGSLGILYWVGEEPFIASRASFTSDQAIKANSLLHGKYKDILHRLDRTMTYLFEIIYPENRIVVDYGEQEALVLLGIIEAQSGKEFPLEAFGFPVVKRYPEVKTIPQLGQLEENNREGFVLRFESGLRLKLKFEEYIRLHRTITMMSSITIWENLKTGQSTEALLEGVPDEFYTWVRRTEAKLRSKYRDIEQQAKSEFKVLASRKETALYFLKCEHPHILFRMLEGKSYQQAIWKQLRPQFEKPFADKQLQQQE